MSDTDTNHPASGPGTTTDPNQADRTGRPTPRTEPAVEVDTDYDRDDPKVGPGTTSDPNQADRT